MQGMQAGEMMGSGIQNAIAGGTPAQVAMKRVSEGGEDPQVVFQELLQQDPQAAQEFAQHMQQISNMGSFQQPGQNQQPMGNGGGMGVMGGLSSLFGGGK